MLIKKKCIHENFGLSLHLKVTFDLSSVDFDAKPFNRLSDLFNRGCVPAEKRSKITSFFDV